MSVKKYLLNKADKLACAGTVVVSALTLGQFPQYIAQYVQRLGGTIDEDRRIAKDEKMHSLNIRADDLERSLNLINNSSGLGKLTTFVGNADWDIAKRAYQNYTPGMTFNYEGLLYSGVGGLTGFGLYELVTGTGKLLRRKKEKE